MNLYCAKSCKVCVVDAGIIIVTPETNTAASTCSEQEFDKMLQELIACERGAQQKLAEELTVSGDFKTGEFSSWISS